LSAKPHASKQLHVRVTGSPCFLEVAVVQWKVCRNDDEFHIVLGGERGGGAQKAGID
jgi:hypothetical protein